MNHFFVPRISDVQDTSYFVDRKEGEKWDTFVEEKKGANVNGESAKSEKPGSDETRRRGLLRPGAVAPDTPETQRMINEINNDFQTARSIGDFEFKNVEELKRVNSQRRNQFLSRRHSVTGTLRLRSQKKSGKKGLVCRIEGEALIFIQKSPLSSQISPLKSASRESTPNASPNTLRSHGAHVEQIVAGEKPFKTNLAISSPPVKLKFNKLDSPNSRVVVKGAKEVKRKLYEDTTNLDVIPIISTKTNSMNSAPSTMTTLSTIKTTQ